MNIFGRKISISHDPDKSAATPLFIVCAGIVMVMAYLVGYLFNEENALSLM